MDVFGAPSHYFDNDKYGLGGRFQVPYLADFFPHLAYDGLWFSKFLDRKNIDRKRLINFQELQGKSKHEILCLIQSFGYFSIIHSVFQVAIGLKWDPVLFLEDSVGTPNRGDPRAPNIRWVSSRNIVRLLHLWRALATTWSDERLEEVYKVVKNALEDIRSFMLVLGTWTLYPPKEDADYMVEHLIRLTISIAGEHLALGLTFGKESIAPTTLNSLTRKDVWGQNKLLELRLLESGWCPSAIYTLIDRGLSHSMLFYLSAFDRHKLRKDHSRCTKSFRCAYEDLDRDQYTTLHTNEDCQCTHVDLNPENAPRISRIVCKGLIPVLTVQELEPGRVLVAVTTAELQNEELKIHNLGEEDLEENDECDLFAELEEVLPTTHEPARPYVCISHVWADGLGNPLRNSLPRCQLLEIQRRVDELYDPSLRPVPFWLDTLCVPLTREHRDMAIIAMRQTYKKADRVLVFDATLSDTTSDVYPHELLARITAGGWVQRLWTFQEAALAKQLHFQFRDRALTIKDISTMRMELEEANDRNILASWAIAQKCSPSDPNKLRHLIMRGDYCYPNTDPVFLEGMQTLWAQVFSQTQRNISTSHADKLTYIADGLCWRWTSRLDDETICLSGVLDLDTTELLKIAANKELPQPDQRSDVARRRMLRFMEGFESVSPNIIFCKQDRFQEDGRRWLPTTFLGGGAWARLLPSEQSAIQLERGLLFSSLAGIKLLDVPLPYGHGNPEMRPYQPPLEVQMTGPGSFHRDTQVWTYVQPDANNIPIGVVSENNGVVDWKKYVHSNLAILLEAPIAGDVHYSRALLVSIQGEEEDVIYARWEELIHLAHVEPPDFQKPKLWGMMPRSHLIPENQFWCVG